MRLPPRQSTAEADLMVPFQLVILEWSVKKIFRLAESIFCLALVLGIEY